MNALYALVTFFAFVSLVTFCTDNGAEVFGKVVCICDYKFTGAVDFGLFNSYTVRTVKTVFAFFTLCTLVAFFALVAFCAYNRSDIGALTVRERKHKFTLRIDFGGRNAYAVFTVGTVCAVHTVYTVRAYYFAEVGRRPVRICNNKLALFIYNRCGNAYTVRSVRAVRAVGTVSAVFSVATVSAHYSAEVGSFAVCISQHKFAFFIYNRRSNTDSVVYCFTDNLVKIYAVAVGIGNNKLALIIDFCRFYPYAVLAVFAVFSACADRLTDIDFCSVGKRNYKVAFFRKCGGADIGFVFFRHCGKGFAPILFAAGISVIDGNLICRFALERDKPIIKASRISLLHRKLVCGQAVFNA